jgi:hypothetical protein
MNDLLVDAKREVLQKPRSQIEQETAFKWAARAVVTYDLFRSTRLPRWLHDSSEYGHEAIEHAALADESGEVLRAVREWMHRHIPPGAI